MAWLYGFAALLGGFWVFYRLLFPRYGWTQAITISFSTPSGPVSGTATQTIAIQIAPRILRDAGGPITRLMGESVVVDLGDGRYVFMRLNLQVRSVLGAAVDAVEPRPQYMQPADRFRRLAVQKEPLAIPQDALPPMVIFTDMTDPKSIQHVPYDTASDVLGPGYSCTGAEIVVTRKASRQADYIHELLPWLPKAPHDPKVTFGRYPYGHPLHDISSSDFIC